MDEKTPIRTQGTKSLMHKTRPETTSGIRAGRWCGERVSNPRPLVCKTRALPLSYRRAVAKL